MDDFDAEPFEGKRFSRIALRMKTTVLHRLAMLCNDVVGENTEAHISLMILLDAFPAAGGRKRAVENVIHALVQIPSRRAYTHGSRMMSESDSEDAFLDPLTAAGCKIWNTSRSAQALPRNCESNSRSNIPY